MTSDNFKHLILETLKVTTIDCMRATIYESKIMHKFLKFVLHLLAKLTMLKLLKTVTHVTRDWWATRATAFQLFTAVPFEFWPFVHFFWFTKKKCAQSASQCQKWGLLSMQKTAKKAWHSCTATCWLANRSQTILFIWIQFLSQRVCESWTAKGAGETNVGPIFHELNMIKSRMWRDTSQNDQQSSCSVALNHQPMKMWQSVHDNLVCASTTKKADNVKQHAKQNQSALHFSKNFVVMQFLFKRSNTRQLTLPKKHQRVCIKRKKELMSLGHSCTCLFGMKCQLIQRWE